MRRCALREGAHGHRGVLPGDPLGTPSHGRRRRASWAFHIVPPGELLHLTEPSLNAWLAVPMGVSLGLMAWMTRSAWPLAVAGVVPLLAEGVQWLLPPLGRAAFLSADVVANWTGVALGMLLATALALAAGTARLRMGRLGP